MATNAAAIPAADWKNLRRLTPCLRASSDPYSLTRASNSRCFSVFGHGMYSSLETHCVGIGERKRVLLRGQTLGQFFWGKHE